MIKNILYSLFLHLLLLTLIYINFKSHITDEVNEFKDGIAISIANFDNNKKSNAANEISPKIDKKKEIKKAVAAKRPEEKKPEKPQALKKKPQAERKEAKKTAATKKSALPPVIEKHNEFKPEQSKEEIKEIEQEKTEDEKSEDEPLPSEPELAEEIIEENQSANSTENIVNDLENLNLSVREKYNIHTQLRGCYHHALHDNYKNNFIVTVKVNVLPDGTINFDAEKLIDMVRYKNPKEKDYRDMMDGIVKALEFCSPLRNMPADKYDVWKEFTIQFGGQ